MKCDVFMLNQDEILNCFNSIKTIFDLRNISKKLIDNECKKNEIPSIIKKTNIRGDFKMEIKTIYLIIQGKHKDKKGKLHNIVTYTDSLEIIEKYKDKILGYEVASINDLNNSEVFDDTFGVDTLRVKEGIVTYKKYLVWYEGWDIEDYLEIGQWELI
nr:hypothetical protein Z953_p0132 [Clostridium botulinum D str. 16868]